MGKEADGARVGDTGLLLSVAAAIAGRDVNAALRAVGLRTRTFSILELTARSDGMRQRRLADEQLPNRHTGGRGFQ